MGISHLSGLEVNGVPTMGMGGLPVFTGNYWFVDPVFGSDGNAGTADSPFATLAQAHAQAVADNDDVVLFQGGGATSGAGSCYQGATLVWSKRQTHLIGLCNGSFYGKRARLAPLTTLAGTAGFNKLVSVTASGCLFANLQAFYGFSNTAGALINWEDDGGRNNYVNCEFLGFGDTTTTTGTANLTGARAFVFNNNVGESTFDHCVFGTNTTVRNATNYTLEIKGGAPRMLFDNCSFQADLGGSGTASSHILIGASGIDRECVIRDSIFLSSIKSAGSAMAQALNVNAAAGGGVLLDCCTAFGITAWETTPSNSVYMNMSAVSAPGGGISLVL
jgi:hypothetical protein